MSSKIKDDRINIRIRADDVEIKQYLSQLHPSVSRSDMARQCILYCIRHQVLHYPLKTSDTNIQKQESYISQSQPRSNDERLPDKLIKQSDQNDDIEESQNNESYDFSALLDSLT